MKNSPDTFPGLVFWRSMEILRKRFSDLTNSELYNILKLRVDVFVVEQKCPYPELDNLDQDAIHVWMEEDGEIVAYLRILDRGVESDHVAIGRVISAKRNQGYGRQILKEGLRAAKEEFNADRIYLEAQVYAIGFYEKCGFHVISEVFIMDGIPHVKMLK